ncbi:complex 1 protein (LYR family) protein [Coccidioides posadasii C735 delta SOWgp]|uniref:Complex 1 protein (LYR family) protein n=1 Tax=Coccidioides posadasii (strain C735) TaxID=222929 RepID=C5PEA9_COCP7|nr:complex 1 protein (LYR family) protein [Coccidioides posadasii C735 delta SOWgp]EER24737.1 complex 1 protein (LYR family) protein [Coccidioides posadasii C735 delta SOWgp]|eukprot:XP_003066882.1 complex 1 protein (LYR family) protein [Coccidioides posadasii C735 delta SOWgp]
MRLSGLQRQVLALYRQCLREIRKKPVLITKPQGSQANFKRYARQEFQKNRDVNRKDFATIEYLLRRGQKQLEMYASPGIRNITP